MSDPYVYPGTDVLRNKLDLQSSSELDQVERRMVQARSLSGAPSGDFDLKHLQAIHHHLFQDVYDWAGKVRTVEISKGGQQFMFRSYINNGMADVHRRLVQAGYLRGLSPKDFAGKAGEIIGDVNYVHPFREGNGRTQLEYLRQLAGQAGHELRHKKLNRDGWIAASKAANMSDYKPMAAEIYKALSDRERTRADRLLGQEQPQAQNRSSKDHDRDRER